MDRIKTQRIRRHDGHRHKHSSSNEGGEDSRISIQTTPRALSDEDVAVTEEIDHFLALILSLNHNDDNNDETFSPPELPVESIKNFLSLLDKQFNHHPHYFSPVALELIDRLARLSSALSAFPSDSSYGTSKTRLSTVLQHAISYLEDQFRILLEDSRTNRKSTSSSSHSHHDGGGDDDDRSGGSGGAPFPPETAERLRTIADIMISLGCESECYQIFSLLRRNAYDSALSDLSFRKISVDDVQRMQWDQLEREISRWVRVFRSVSASFAHEFDLCNSVFPRHPSLSASLFGNLVRDVVIQLLYFVETVATVVQRAAEKLFKVLDMYEALRDMLVLIDDKFPADDEKTHSIKSEIAAARSRLGEVARSMFCELESSIRNDPAKTPVPGGAVHPLTRYVVNYLKYACEYKKSLEQVFDEGHVPLGEKAVELMGMMETNLELKSKLYKDSALSYIFLMNNGRYIVKNIKESAEMYGLVGEAWYRKLSGELRQYHKNYQRETWNKVLSCLKDEGLQAKGGSVSKQAVKEKMKTFNGVLEDLLRRQCSWVVSDEQLKSELRVSISAVLVPAYRSFLGRYRQYLDAKHIKFGPEELESRIDELFDGITYSSHGRKR